MTAELPDGTQAWVCLLQDPLGVPWLARFEHTPSSSYSVPGSIFPPKAASSFSPQGGEGRGS